MIVAGKDDETTTSMPRGTMCGLRARPSRTVGFGQRPVGRESAIVANTSPRAPRVDATSSVLPTWGVCRFSRFGHAGFSMRP